MSVAQQEATTLCNLWILQRTDGMTFGFTNHDEDILHEGVLCQAASGLTGAALQSSTGLSVDNTEALGALQSTVISPEDIAKGRYDDAGVEVLLYDWAAGAVVREQLRATIGEVQIRDGTFIAELRGRSDRLNQPQGRVFQPACDARLGDGRCKVDLDQAAYRAEATVTAVRGQRILDVTGLESYSEGWFERGTVELLENGAPVMASVIKSDKITASGRAIEMWFSTNHEIPPGTVLRITAGCNKRLETCRVKFSNVLNYRGFPTIPGEDWAMSYPSSRLTMNGGQR